VRTQLSKYRDRTALTVTTKVPSVTLIDGGNDI